jgi:alkylation response protein AidB-like acyl-CoA dehydrogenase
MAFRSLPLFDGDLFDTALRLAGSPEAQREPGTGHTQAGEKWQQMLALGWQGVLVAEEDGGAGARLQDMAAIVEAAARHGQLAPLTERCAVAPLLLSAAREHPAAQALLNALTLGEASVCPGLDAGEQGPGRVHAPLLERDGQLTGSLLALDLTEPASHVLFRARDAESHESVLVLLDWSRLAAAARHHQGLDGRQFSDVSLDGVRLTADDILLRGAPAAQAVMRARQTGSLLVCVQAVGAAAAMIELTIEYLNTRIQFGVALSSFQALRHRTVEMYVAYENTSGLVRRLVEQAEAADPAQCSRDVVLAKLYAAQVARMVSESAIQLHGGMGMTWEMLAARLAMLAMAGSLQYGDAAECLDWLTAQEMSSTVGPLELLTP